MLYFTFFRFGIYTKLIVKHISTYNHNLFKQCDLVKLQQRRDIELMILDHQKKSKEMKNNRYRHKEAPKIRLQSMNLRLNFGCISDEIYDEAYKFSPTSVSYRFILYTYLYLIRYKFFNITQKILVRI